MPVVSVFLDGKKLVSVRTEENDVLSVCLGGTRVEDEFAELYMSAGSHRGSGESTHLIWLNSLSVLPGQLVKVELSEDGETSEVGKTIDELFPNEKTDETFDFNTTEEMFSELRARPARRPGFKFEVKHSAGPSASAETTPDQHGFGFSVLWNVHRPQRASVSLHTYSIDNMEQRTPMKYHLQEHLELGQSVSVKVDA